MNPADNVNVRRILNVPKRGLGARAEGLVAGYADAHGLTFFESIEHMDQIEGMTGRTTKPLGAFRDLMHELADFAKEHDSKPSEVVAEVLDKSGLLEELQRSEDPQDASRVDNLSQLQSVAAEFEQNTPDATLAGFLETTALVADSDQLPGEGEDSGKVTMMTLHTAKGLEYPYVFLTGMEQGTFPHQRAMEDTSELSEERRLAYVGITRAKRRLYVTRAAVRAQWGQANGSMYGSSTYGSSSYGSGSRGSHPTYGSSHGSHSSYGSGRSSYGSGSRRFSGGSHSGSSSYGSYGSSRSSYGSGKPSGKSGKVTTRRAKPKDLTKSALASSLDGNNGLSISDFQIGDRITHDHYGLGKVIETQDKGANSVITVDFGTDGVKRLLLRVAPIEKL